MAISFSGNTTQPLLPKAGFPRAHLPILIHRCFPVTTTQKGQN